MSTATSLKYLSRKISRSKKFTSFSQNRYTTSNSQNKNIQIIIQDQTQTEVITQIIIKIVINQSPKIEIIRTTVPEIPHIIETGINQTKQIDNTQIIDHENIQTTDQTILIITIDYVKILEIEFLIIKTDRETILNHHTGKIHNIRNHIKTINVIHLNIKDKSIRYNQLKKINQTRPVLTTQEIQICN